MNNSAEVLQKLNAIIVTPAIRLVFAAGFFLFMWGIVEFFWNLKDGGEGTSTGKQHMIWGIVGMFIMIAVGGILNIVTSTFGINVNGGSVPQNGNLNAPQATFQL